MRRALLFGAAIAGAGCHPAPPPTRSQPPPPTPCIGARPLSPQPIDVPGYPIARVPLDDAGRSARIAELAAKHPGWHFEVDEYGTVQRAGSEATYPATAPFDAARFDDLLATLQREGLVAPELRAAPTATGASLIADGAVGVSRGSAQMFLTPQHTAFIDASFVLPNPSFPPPPGAHMLTQDEIFARWDPARDHVAVVQALIANMPCDRAPGYDCSSPPAAPPARCVPVRQLELTLVTLGDGQGHQHLVYASHAQMPEMIMQSGIPECIDAFTGAALPAPCRPY